MTKISWLEDVETARPSRISRLSLAMLFAIVCAAHFGCQSKVVDPTGLQRGVDEEIREEALRLLTLSMNDHIEKTIRVQRIAYRLQAAGTELCGDHVGPIFPVAIVDPQTFHYRLQSLVKQRFSVSRQPFVAALFNVDNLAESRLKMGDILLRADGVALRRASSLSRVRPKPGSSTITLEVQRAGSTVEVSMPYQRGCRVFASLSRRQARNASTDLYQIWVNSGVLQAFDDDRVAFVIGHEIGHVIVAEVLERGTRGAAQESDADHVALYLSARAGYAPIATGVWEKFKRDLDSLAGKRNGSHPSTAERRKALRIASAEVARKMEAGEPLEPTW